MKINNTRWASFLLIALFFSYASLFAQSELEQKLSVLPDISGIEKLQSDHYPEKYLVRITQPLDHKDPSKGSFTQRVIVSHRGFDRPTVIVTEGYGGNYALRTTYQEELSAMFETNMVFVEHRYFLESTPDPVNWDYLTAENSAYDLHHINTTFKTLYPGKWISTGISKGGQTTMLYRAYFPDDVDISVPYVAPLNEDIEDKRHEEFLRNVGTAEDRQKIEAYQIEVLKRREQLLPLLEKYSENKNLTYTIPLTEVFDYCVLEYPFALWQWGISTNTIPPLDSEDKMIFDHLVDISGPDYFVNTTDIGSFFVQAARELGYYTYDVEPFKEHLSITSSEGYLQKIMMPESAGIIPFDRGLYDKVSTYLLENDPKMIFIYGEYDPWSATRVPDMEGKHNLLIYIEPGGSHRARIGTMHEETQQEIYSIINGWLSE